MDIQVDEMGEQHKVIEVTDTDIEKYGTKMDIDSKGGGCKN